MSQYIVVKPFAGLELGAIVEPNEQYSEEFLQTLASGGFLHLSEEAGAEEVKQEEEVSPVADATEEVKAAAPVAPATKSFIAEAKEQVKVATKEAIKENIQKSLKKAAPRFSVAAEVKESPVKNLGHAIHLALKAAQGDTTARNKVASVFGKSYKGSTLTFAKSPTGNATTSTALGDALVPARWHSTLHEKALQAGSLIDRCEVIDCPDGSDTYNFPCVNDVSRANGSRPARHYVVGQSDAATVAAAPFENVQAVLVKVACVNAATEELLQDNNYGYWEKVDGFFGDEMAFAFNKYLFSGTGSNEPGAGVMNATMTYAVTPFSPVSQSFNFRDINNMFASMPTRNRATACWFGGPQTTAILEGLAYDHSATSKVPAYGITYSAENAWSMKLKGITYIENEHCSIPGIAGDLALVDCKQFGVLSKDIEISVNPYANWLNGEALCKAVWRFDIKPLWKNKVQRLDGGYWSPSIILGTRAST